MIFRKQLSSAREGFRRQVRLLRRPRGLQTIQSVKANAPHFDSLVQKIRQAGTDNFAYFGSDYAREGGLSLQQNSHEFAALICFLQKSPPIADYLEIGSASGGACRMLFEEVGFQRVISLDDGRHPRAPEQPANFSVLPDFRQFKGDSHGEEARNYLKKEAASGLDVAFVDGDHSAEGVWMDIQLVRPFLRPGALLLLHDTIACSGVAIAWRKISADPQFEPLAEFIGSKRPMGISIARVRNKSL